MSQSLARLVLPIVVVSLALGAAACARKSSPAPVAQTPSAPPVARAQTTPPPAASVPDKPGIVYAERIRARATVEAIDPATRKVTLKRADGTSVTLKAPPEARNFDQIQVGDTVNAEYIDAVVVFVRKAGSPPATTEMAIVGCHRRAAGPA